jgi:putative acetyltransferase
MLKIRREGFRDKAAIADVHRHAFRRPFAPLDPPPVEVALVDALRESDAWIPHLSFVALDVGEIVGHVVCTRAWLDPDELPVLGLGPLGVLPHHQGLGVGSALMHTVLGAADALDEILVGLLGDPGFYRRFGFEPAYSRGVKAPDPEWGAHFQVRTLSTVPPFLQGTFRYAAPFDGLS